MRVTTTWVLAAAVAVGLGGSAWAGQVVEKASFKGKNAFVAFNGSTAIVCPDESAGTLETTVFLSGFENVTKSRLLGDSRANLVFAQLIQHNSCTDTFFTAQGSVAGAFSANGLSGASMVAVIPLSGFEGTVVLAVDVQLTATGRLVKTRTLSRTEVESPDGGTVVTFMRFAGKTRQAVATGTLTLDGTPLVGTFSGAFIDDSKSGEMIVEH